MLGVCLLEALLNCVTQCGVQALSPENVTCHFTFTFTFMLLADAFIQSDLQCIQAIHVFYHFKNKHSFFSVPPFLYWFGLFLRSYTLTFKSKAEFSTAWSGWFQKLGIIQPDCFFCKCIFICLSVTRIISVYEASGFELEKKATVTPAKSWVRSQIRHTEYSCLR